MVLTQERMASKKVNFANSNAFCYYPLVVQFDIGLSRFFPVLCFFCGGLVLVCHDVGICVPDPSVYCLV